MNCSGSILKHLPCCDIICLVGCIILLLIIFAVIIGAIIFVIRLKRLLKNASCNQEIIKSTSATSAAGNHDPEPYEIYESNDLYSHELNNYEAVNDEPLRQNNADELEVYECNDQYMSFESNNYETVN